MSPHITTGNSDILVFGYYVRHGETHDWSIREEFRPHDFIGTLPNCITPSSWKLKRFVICHRSKDKYLKSKTLFLMRSSTAWMPISRQRGKYGKYLVSFSVSRRITVIRSLDVNCGAEDASKGESGLWKDGSSFGTADGWDIGENILKPPEDADTSSSEPGDCMACIRWRFNSEYAWR